MVKAGTVIDERYRLRGLLGRGAMAEVYVATDLRLDRTVALKVARSEGTDDCGERNKHEAHALARLDHPNVVRMFDAGCWNGLEYLVLEHIDGPSLGLRLRDGPLSPGEATRIAGQTASALAYLHEQGIVHRDVKPANILLDRRGNAHLADFGTAIVRDGTRLTATGHAIGTASYLSPEQVRGHDIGPRTDIYALGLVLLECLTGRREYGGTPSEAAIARLSRQPVVDDDVPAPWRNRIKAMTALKPEARPSAATVAGWVAADDATMTTTIALPAAANRTPKRGWLRAGIGAAAAAAAIATTGYFWPNLTGSAADGSASSGPAAVSSTSPTSAGPGASSTSIQPTPGLGGAAASPAAPHGKAASKKTPSAKPASAPSPDGKHEQPGPGNGQGGGQGDGQRDGHGHGNGHGHDHG